MCKNKWYIFYIRCVYVFIFFKRGYLLEIEYKVMSGILFIYIYLY